MGFRGLLITGIFTLWHKGNLIPRCLCNPEKLHSKETVGKLKSLLKKNSITSFVFFKIISHAQNNTNTWCIVRIGIYLFLNLQRPEKWLQTVLNERTNAAWCYQSQYITIWFLITVGTVLLMYMHCSKSLKLSKPYT